MKTAKRRAKQRPERLVCYVAPTLKQEAERAAIEAGVSTSTFVGLALRAYLASTHRRLLS